MDEIKKLISDVAALRDRVKTIVAEAKDEVPHLINAAGALHTAVTNLEGQLAKAANEKAEIEN